jgi:hypothetical protein
MLGRLRQSEGRQFAAMIVIFALMLQSILLAVASARLFANAAGDTNFAGFEICSHNSATYAGGNAAAPGSAPKRSDTQCCISCLGGAHALEAPLLSAEFHLIALKILPWIFTEWRIPAVTVHAGARPRGPPRAA